MIRERKVDIIIASAYLPDTEEMAPTNEVLKCVEFGILSRKFHPFWVWTTQTQGVTDKYPLGFIIKNGLDIFNTGNDRAFEKGNPREVLNLILRNYILSKYRYPKKKEEWAGYCGDSRRDTGPALL